MTPCLFQLKSFDDGYVCSNQLFADTLFLTFNIIYFVFNVLTTLIPLICLFLSILASLMITICLIKQSKFQWNHNRKDLYNSSRICVVIFLQSFLNSFILILLLIAQLHWYFLIVTRFFPIQILTHTQKYGETSPQKQIIYFRLPIWVHGEWGLASNDALQLILQFRIFIESFIILFIMTGYREALWKFVKLVFFAIRNPKTFWNETLHNKTSIVILTSSG